MHARERAQLVSGNATSQLRSKDDVQPCTRCLVAHACTLLLLRKAVWWHTHHQQRLHLSCGAADRRGHVWPGAGREQEERGRDVRDEEGLDKYMQPGAGMSGTRVIMRSLNSTFSQVRGAESGEIEVERRG